MVEVEIKKQGIISHGLKLNQITLTGQHFLYSTNNYVYNLVIVDFV